MKVNLTLIYDRRGQATKDNPAVIELRITINNVRRYVSTGVKVLPKEWHNGSVVGRRDFKELNDRLQAVKRKCSEIVCRMIDEGTLDANAIPNLLRDSIMQRQTFIEYAKQLARCRYKKITPGTQEHYKLFFKFLESWKGIVSFSDITERNIMKLDRALEDKGLKVSSRWNYHKMVQTFILQAKDDGLIKVNPYTRLDIKRGNESGLTRVLTPEEFHRFECSVQPTESLQRVKDLFVFQTYTMMGYSDLAAFDYKKCFNVNGQIVYKGRRKKTGKEFTFALLKPAMAILQKYGYKLPMISNTKYNLYLKSAVQFAKIDKPVSCHWARHTGATLLLNEGKVDMNTISKILGDTLRETERTYAKLMDESIVESMVGYQDLTERRARIVSL